MVMLCVYINRGKEHEKNQPTLQSFYYIEQISQMNVRKILLYSAIGTTLWKFHFVNNHMR